MIRTPIRAPKANAYAERWIQTVRTECLDWTLVLDRRDLVRLLRVYVRHSHRTAEGTRVITASPPPARRSSQQPFRNILLSQYGTSRHRGLVCLEGG
jgi:putative transposase